MAADGWKCRDSFFPFRDEKACFTGKRSEAIDIINSLYYQDYFDGTDGEYINDAHYKGKNEISYIFYDEANDYSEKMILKRCIKKFFDDETT